MIENEQDVNMRYYVENDVLVYIGGIVERGGIR